MPHMTSAVRDYLENCLIGEDIDSDVWRFLESANLIPDTIVRMENGTAEHNDNCCMINGEWYLTDDCFTCDHCEESGFSDDSHNVDNETWCDNCRQHNAYYWDSDESYHSEPEPETETDVCEITGYHDIDVSPSSPRRLADDVIGPELETFWDCPQLLADWMTNNDMVPDNGWKAERDGSLDSSHGVEIVSSPIPYADLILADVSNKWYRLFQFARGKSRAWDMGTGYGLHLSVNRARMSPLHAIKFSRFINGNPALSCSVAGRSEQSLAKYRKHNKASQQGYSQEKYLACAMRDARRIEVRIFRASWNWERFVRNVQFVESIRRYTLDCSLSDFALSDAQYLLWIAAQPAGEFRTLRVWFAAKNLITESVSAHRVATSLAVHADISAE